jgi:hypothetical protein
MKQTRALLPEAHLIEVEDGPLSRPDLTADAVRMITTAAPARAGAGESPAD